MHRSIYSSQRHSSAPVYMTQKQINTREVQYYEYGGVNELLHWGRPSVRLVFFPLRNCLPPSQLEIDTR